MNKKRSLEGSETPVLYRGRTVLKVNQGSVNNARRRTALVYKEFSQKLNFIVGL